MIKRGQEETPLFSVRLARSSAALIILNKINVSRNSNKNALLTKADQIIVTQEGEGGFKRREYRRKSGVRKKGDDG